jgi:hypothetical protein
METLWERVVEQSYNINALRWRHFSPLGYCAVQTVTNRRTFQRCLPVSSSGHSLLIALIMEVVTISETSVSLYHGHGAITQKTVTFILVAVRTWNFTMTTFLRLRIQLRLNTIMWLTTGHRKEASGIFRCLVHACDPPGELHTRASFRLLTQTLSDRYLWNCLRTACHQKATNFLLRHLQRS